MALLTYGPARLAVKKDRLAPAFRFFRDLCRAKTAPSCQSKAAEGTAALQNASVTHGPGKQVNVLSTPLPGAFGSKSSEAGKMFKS